MAAVSFIVVISIRLESCLWHPLLFGRVCKAIICNGSPGNNEIEPGHGVLFCMSNLHKNHFSSMTYSTVFSEVARN